VQGADEPPQCFSVTGGVLRGSPLSTAAIMPGGLGRVGMTLSANGTEDGTGILWEAGGNYLNSTAPGTLYAFDASNLNNELWDSTMNAAQDSPGAFVKFANPTVANGKVYLPTLSNSVTVYGLLPNNGGAIPVVSAIVNSASSLTGAVAPGEMIALYGSGLGAASPAGMELDVNGVAGAYLAGTEVWFNGTPAPLLYASGNQVNTVVPFGLASSSTEAQSTQVQVGYEGRMSAPITLALVPAQPGIFSADGSGAGQGQILNADGSMNSAANPAARGSVVVVYATGLGQTSPAGLDGAISSPGALPSPALPISAEIGGQAATVISATDVPGMVQGFVQVQVQIPAETTPGAAVPVVLQINGVTSQAGLFLAVRSWPTQPGSDLDQRTPFGTGRKRNPE
jgi:uncharacterized protein (TIGR03437 family)